MTITGQKVVDSATTLVGKIPYKLGATVGETAALIAADCSSFVQYIYTGFHIDLPRTADKQFQSTMTGGDVRSPIDGSSYAHGTTVSLTDLQLGDLIFFGGWNDPTNPPGYADIQHVAIYAGNGKIVEEGGVVPDNVNVSLLSDSLFVGKILYATRVDSVVQNVIVVPRYIDYTVFPKQSETLTKIAARVGLKPEDIRAFNKMPSFNLQTIPVNDTGARILHIPIDSLIRTD